jgi:hypothetical protein
LGGIANAKPDAAHDDMTALFGAVATLKDHFERLSDAQRWILVEIAYRRSADLKAHYEQELWPSA